ncbi:MAG TPA: single-stranded DNA-binding protein [Candidatus Kapabacteria bacterium]|jgi:single-strand DNA-binding protein|nr:single-stranded DNA-binding protein [Candidatus Kapabacteria bacterium]HOV91674.1 single-stranded DNA-binding protein [Candidatus Kapabacteria bacterium]
MANRSLNRATLLGNVGNTPELRSTPQGVPVTSIRLATHSLVKDRDGRISDVTEWHNVVFWRDLANKAVNLLKKSTRIYVEGPLKTRKYEKDGNLRAVTEIVADMLIVLDNRKQPDEEESDEENE